MSAAVIVVTPDQLRELVRDAVREALASSGAPDAPGRLLTKSELARELSCSVATIDRMTREGAPFVTVGRTRRYDGAAVRAWLGKRAPTNAAPDACPTAPRLLSRGGAR